MKALKGIVLKKNRILVQRFSKEEKTASGIYMPESEQEAPEGGVIVSVGPDADGVKVGDKVRYMTHVENNTVDVDREEYLLMRDDDVWAQI